jgi:hypothetical protein
MRPYGQTRKQGSALPHGAWCSTCYPRRSKRAGRRKARELAKRLSRNEAR